jgi:hypothetical protein
MRISSDDCSLPSLLYLEIRKSKSPPSVASVSTMVQIGPYVASLLALGQGVTAAKAVSSFSEWIEGIVADPKGDNMTPKEVVKAFKAGQFSSSPEGMSAVRSTHLAYMEANLREHSQTSS